MTTINDRSYVIFDIAELDKIDFDQVEETSANTLRYSADGTKTFVKFVGNPPASVDALTTKSAYYQNSQMLDILNQPEWSNFSGNV